MSAQVATRKPSTAKAAANTTTRVRGEGPNLSEALIGKAVNTDSLDIVQRKLSTKYIPFVNACLNLKRGQSFTIKLPPGTEMKKFRATIGTTLKKRTATNFGNNRPDKLKFGALKDGSALVVMCVAND